MKISQQILLVAAALTLTACGDLCGTNVPETTQLKNSTTQTLSIELCKVPDKLLTGEATDKIEIKAKIAVFDILANQEGNFATDDYQISEKKEGNKECEKKAPVSYSSQIFLTSKSIFQVKLCRSTTDPNTTTLVALNMACPAGHTAQTQAVVNCNDTALIAH